ncbi:hypothetical protein [Sellimonas sp.]|uniref:hypothetical protein n=1 Tax=Sellimonas sp. TaxID=2021466 RepID=UPI00257A8AB8|nr:hypothetical protein [Sellimonas sp.]
MPEKKNIKNLTIWVGAGISMESPSCLPSGNRLTEFAFDQVILGKNRFLKIWDEINSYERQYCNISITRFPRLELLLSSIAYIEKFFMGKESLKGKFLSGLKAFDQVPFNQNHMLVAVLAHAGARVMTANFDMSIERAYESLYAEKCDQIIHFHGTYLSGDKIGATIENITHMVNKTVENKVKSSFNQGRTNYFYGYSFSDMYDINETIYSLYSDEQTSSKYTKDNWVCNHKGFDRELKWKVKRAFWNEGNIHIFEEHTTEALKNLCLQYSLDIPAQVITLKENAQEQSYDWERLFLKETEITEELRVLSTIHFYNRMHIAIDCVNPSILEQYEQFDLKNEKREILEYHLAANSRYWYKKYGDTRLKTDYHKIQLQKKLAGWDKRIIFDVQMAKHRVEDVVENLKHRQFVMYEDFAELNNRIRQIRFQMLRNVPDIDVSETTYLLRQFEKIPIGKYIEIILYASIYRYKLLLKSAEGIDGEEDFRRANEIYYDIGEVEGMLASRLDFIIGCNYRLDQTRWSKTFRSGEWSALKHLCEITGSYCYIQRMKAEELLNESNYILPSAIS